MYDLTYTIFCPIGSALAKHLVVAQIWTHNSKWLAYKLYRLSVPVCGEWGGSVYDLNIESKINLAGNANDKNML